MPFGMLSGPGMENEEDVVTRRAEARIGTVLKDKWRLDKLLGVGGMASVYAATHRNGKRVAVKMLHPEISLDAAMRQRFLREGYVANKVGHRGAVAVDDDDTTNDGAAFLVMELLEGETLDARMRRKGGKLSQAEVLSAMDQVLDTLAAAHEQGIVHRDLKPENIFMTKDGVMKILDFGIARIREMSGTSSATQTGSLMGTPAFMPPEQARGRWDDVDARSDLWAVGATMFTLLTGRLVHEAETPNEALVLAVTARARSLATIDPVVIPAVAALVDKALAYESEGRFQTAREMQAAGRAAYAAVEGSARMPQLSVPDVPPEHEASIIVSDSSRKPATSTTGRAVAASVVGSDVPKKGIPAVPRRSRVIPAAVAGAVLLLVGGGVLLSKGGSRPGAEPSAAAPAAAPPAPEPATARHEPEVVPAAPPTAGKAVRTVSVDSLPIDKTGAAEGKPRAKEAAPTASVAQSQPEGPGTTKPSTGATEAPAQTPAWLPAAAAAHSAAPAKPPAPKKPSNDDLFSKRF